MRKISATYIFPGNQRPLKNGILVCDDSGTITDLIDTGGKITEQTGLEYYSGIIVPGFVNCHCHLELSHMKGKIQEKTGIGGFIGAINQLRNNNPDEQENIAGKADRYMWANGTTAVGDISNTSLTIPVKRKSKLYYHTFVEVFGFHPSRAERAFSKALEIKNEFSKCGLPSSVVPHSAYSVSLPLFEKIGESAEKEDTLLSIHNQESQAESQFMADGSGPIAHHISHNLGIDMAHWTPQGISPLEWTLPNIPKQNQLLLVHNTCMGKRDLEFLKTSRSLENTYLVLCAGSNLFIENQLPPVPLFVEENLRICLGTDSLASNHHLSVLREMITIQEHFPETGLDQLIQWACANGADALRISDWAGSFEKGKKPGVNLITGLNLQHLKLTNKSVVKRLL